MTYQEYKEKAQSRFNALPIKYAFGQDQFKRMMESWGLTENDTDKIYSIGCGGFFLRSDAEIIHEYFAEPDELPELMKDYDFAFDAIYYEMGNHEYHINNYQGNWDVCSCFGDVEYNDWDDEEKYFDQLDWSETTRKAYRDAKSKFLYDAAENDWY